MVLGERREKKMRRRIWERLNDLSTPSVL